MTTTPNLLKTLAGLNKGGGSVDESTAKPLAMGRPDRLTVLRAPDQESGKQKTEKAVEPETPAGMSAGTIAIAGIGFLAAVALGVFANRK